MCSGSTDQCELTEFFVVMLSVDISQCLLRSKYNIEHDVTNCPFLTKKYSKCDSLADFLSYLEHVMIEAIELLNKFEESKPETCMVGIFGLQSWQNAKIRPGKSLKLQSKHSQYGIFSE